MSEQLTTSSQQVPSNTQHQYVTDVAAQTSETTHNNRIIAEIPKPQPHTVTRHIIQSYMYNDMESVRMQFVT